MAVLRRLVVVLCPGLVLVCTMVIWCPVVGWRRTFGRHCCRHRRQRPVVRLRRALRGAFAIGGCGLVCRVVVVVVASVVVLVARM